jgi:hypothetical protein
LALLDLIHTSRVIKIRRIRPAPLETAANHRREEQLAARIQAVFDKAKAQALPQLKPIISRLAQKIAKQDEGDPELNRILSIDLSAMEDIATQRPPDELMEAAQDAGRYTLAAIGPPNVDDLVNQVNDAAEQWAQERAAELVGMKYVDGELVPNPNPEWSITDATRDMLRNTIHSSMQAGMGVDEMTDAISDSFAFSPERSRMIARTEISFSHNQGAQMGYNAAQDAGVTVKKQWIVGKGACDECLDLADQDPIPSDDTWDSDEGRIDGPPLHPNCRCTTVAVVTDETGQETEVDEEDTTEE